MFFRPLREVSLQDLADYGGKAAHLGEAMSLGCPVPDGLVLSTWLFRRFMRQGGLQGEIASILATMQPTAMAHFQAAEWAIQEAFKVRRMPDEVLQGIREAWQTLGSTSVAVRSSAASEESTQHSFVGQHAMALGVATEEAAIKAILGCWMSLFSAKALSYAYHFGLDLTNSAMAVILQAMITPASRGALFTADPISGSPDVFLLEVQEGQDVGVHRLDPYGRQPAEPRHWTQLREIGLLLDEHSLAYQTIKWALVNDQVYLLRVRPATQVPPHLPACSPDMAAQVARGPMELVHPSAMTPRALRPYSWYHRSRSQSLNAAYFGRVSRLFGPFVGRDDLYLCGYLYTRWRRSNLPSFDEQVDPVSRFIHSVGRLNAARTLDREFRLLWREKRPRLDELEQTDLCRLPNRELGEYLSEVMALNEAFSVQCGRLGDSHRALADIFLRLHRLWLGDTTDGRVLLVAEDDQMMRRDEALMGLALRGDMDDAARETAFESFLRRYRHLFVRGQPLTDGQDLCALHVDEAAARAALQARIQRGETGTSADERARAAAERDLAEQRVFSRLNPLQRAIYRHVLSLTRRYAPLHVDRDEPVLLCWLLEGDTVREVGRRLQAEGLIATTEESGFLSYREILDWLRGTLRRDVLMRLMMERRDLYRRWWRYAPPDILGDRPPTSEVAMQLPIAEGDTMRGLAVSPGLAQGRARVVCTLAEATNVLPGEVLVVREPLFELSPWFGVASAVVAETGWLLDDAAVLAREYGVPAIFRVQGATERIRNGEELQVDANRGMVIRRPVEQDWDFL